MSRYLLAAGANPALAADDGMTALHFATQNGNLGIYISMYFYIVFDFFIQPIIRNIYHENPPNLFKLHLYVLECAHILLNLPRLPRNFINVKDDGGWTPLVWACEHKHEDVIR